MLLLVMNVDILPYVMGFVINASITERVWDVVDWGGSNRLKVKWGHFKKRYCSKRTIVKTDKISTFDKWKIKTTRIIKP